jgi:sugar phosphate isomerase/epimerase
MKAKLFPAKTAVALARRVASAAGWDRAYVPVRVTGGWLLAGRRNGRRVVGVGFPSTPPRWAVPLDATDRATHSLKEAVVWTLDATHEVLKGLRLAFPFLSPSLSGGRPSVGFGDRTGLATPGHVRALGRSKFLPIFAQQSIREMTRTARTPDQVMDDAVFGVLQAGWLGGWGADADHLKLPEDVERTARAGFVLFTLDVGEHIGKDVAKRTDAELAAAVAEIPGSGRWMREYLGKTFRFPGFAVTFAERTLRETIVKYGRAVLQAALLADRAKSARGTDPCEIEMSVDETHEDTTEADHVFVARELRERGVRMAAIAPKFIGDFEKGIDYRGDRKAFEASIARHAAIAKALGGHKLSVHSGSDKFSLYPAVARATKGRFHLKTAGTSWLEALRAVCRKEPALFREIADFARGRYEQDRATYFISGRVEDVPPPGDLADRDLERVYLDEDAGRQILHVTYGSVFQSPLKPRLFEVLVREEEEYARCVARHLGRHVAGLLPKRAGARSRVRV